MGCKLPMFLISIHRIQMAVKLQNEMRRVSTNTLAGKYFSRMLQTSQRMARSCTQRESLAELQHLAQTG